MARIILFLSVWGGLWLIAGCHPRERDQAYTQSIEKWHKAREERLTRRDGWLSLAGLFWLKEGQNTFGSDKENDIVFPAKAPALIGKFILTHGKVRAVIQDKVPVFTNSTIVHTLLLKSDADGSPTVLKCGTLSWYVIKRGDRYLIRLKDSANPNISRFKGIARYPVDKKWRVRAFLQPYDPPKKIAIANVLGQLSEEPCPGALIFKINDKEYRLDPIAEAGSDELFLIFSDETSGRTTYGAGRFLDIKRPDSSGYTYIDFNKAYNPPCAFSDFATCPLPPRQNHLPLKISAGEKDYDHHP